MDEENKKIDIGSFFGRLNSVEEMANSAILKSDSNLGIINEQKSLIENISTTIESLKTEIKEINNYIVIQKDEEEDRRFEEEDARQKQEMAERSLGLQGKGTGVAAGAGGVAAGSPTESNEFGKDPVKRTFNPLKQGMNLLRLGGSIAATTIPQFGASVMSGIGGFARGIGGLFKGKDKDKGKIDPQKLLKEEKNIEASKQTGAMLGLDKIPEGSKDGEKIETVGDKITAFLDKGKDFIKGLGKKDDGIGSYKELIEAGGIVEDTGQIGSGIGAMRSITVKYPLEEDKAFGAADMMSGKKSRAKLKTRSFMIQGNTEEAIKKLEMPIEEYINKFVFGGFEAGAVTEVSDEEAKKIIEAEDKEYGTIGDTTESEDEKKETKTDNKKVETENKSKPTSNILSGLTKGLENLTKSPLANEMKDIADEDKLGLENIANKASEIMGGKEGLNDFKDNIIGTVKNRLLGSEGASNLMEKIESSFDKIQGIIPSEDDLGELLQTNNPQPVQPPSSGNKGALVQKDRANVAEVEIKQAISDIAFVNLARLQSGEFNNIKNINESDLPASVRNLLKIK